MQVFMHVSVKNILKKGDTLWQNIFLVLYKKELTYEMLSENIDSFKSTLLVGQVFLGCWLHNRNTGFPQHLENLEK